MMGIDTKALKAGDHLISSRISYTHHGIYIGNNKVIHYAGFCEGFKSGKIEITCLQKFTQNKRTRVLLHPNRKYSCKQSLKRAKSRLSEDRYNLLSNNCEPFVNWCIYGQHRSHQVTKAIRIVASLATAPALIQTFRNRSPLIY